MMRALSHPARMIVFDLLGSKKSAGEDGATATEIAKAAGMTPSAMSYHLRTLAKAGFIEEAPSRGDARERVWRLAISDFSIESEPDAPESHHLAEAAMIEAFMEAQDRRTRRWHQVRRELDPDSELYQAQTFSQGGGLLTPEEATEFIRRIYEVIEDYVEMTRKRASGEAAVPDGAERYEYILRVFPDM
jgi:DNA-binding transcriptional ArsR family regulator